MLAYLSPRSFACLNGRGTLKGIETLYHDIDVCSEHYSKDCLVMTLDIENFFMSLPKAEVAGSVTAFIGKHYRGTDKEELQWLANVIISHHPEQNCTYHCPRELWNRLAKGKSLFTCEAGRGLPIGDLTSQMAANIYMDEIDKLFDKLGLPYHGRYVDDIYVVGNDKARMLNALPILREALKEKGLTLHRRKFYMQHYSKGVKWLGMYCKPGRIYAGNKTVHSFRKSVHSLSLAADSEEIVTRSQRVNSYLGYLSHGASYGIRRMVLNNADIFGKVYVAKRFGKVVPPRKYRRNETINDIAKNNKCFARLTACDAIAEIAESAGAGTAGRARKNGRDKTVDEVYLPDKDILELLTD
jgi:hypothetical protein